MASVGQARDFVIDSTGKLTALSNQSAFISGTGGDHFVRFSGAGYSNPGTLTLASAITADAIVFERLAPDTAMIAVSSTFLSLKGLTNTTVILRGLAFRLSPNAKLIEGLVGGSPNQDLVLEDCLIVADSLSGTFLAWLGGTGSRVDLRRCMLVNRAVGASTKIDLQAGAVSLQNSLFNFEGVTSCKVDNLIQLTRNTISRTQFYFTTDGTAKYIFNNNHFAAPPLQNRLGAGGTDRFTMRFLGDFTAPGSSATTNLRDTTWTGFDYPAADSLFKEPTNTKAAATKPDTTLWDWRMASDTVHGAWTGPTPSSRLPSFNLWPGKSLVAVRLNGRDSVEADFAPASIPRIVSLQYDTNSYPEGLDSTRSLWRKDTAISVIGLASLTRLTLPLISPAGKPRLYSSAALGGTYAAGTIGTEGSRIFTNGTTAAKFFIPTFAGQNTLKGSNVSVKVLTPDTLVRFTQITRTGRTTFADPEIFNLGKRYRPMLRESKPFGLQYNTNAEDTASNSDSVTLGLSKSATTEPFLKTALVAYDGSTYRPVSDLGGKYGVTLPFAATGKFSLFERLALGSGDDTLTLGKRIVTTHSDSGHQLTVVDSSFLVTVEKAPSLGKAEKGIAFTWPGRKTSDAFNLTLSKSFPQLEPFLFEADTAIKLTPISSSDSQVTVSLAYSDSGKPVFLAREYPILANRRRTYPVGQDTLIRFLSKTPGAMSFDTNLNVESLKNDTLHLLAKRRFLNDNLTIEDDSYRVAIKTDSAPKKEAKIKAFVAKDSVWGSLSANYDTDRYWRMELPKDATGFAIFEVLPKTDTVKVDPIDTTSKPDSSKILLSLKLSPDTLRLTSPGKTGNFRVVFTPDSAKGAVTYKSLDSEFVSVDDTGLVRGLKPGEGRIQVISVAFPKRMDTALVTIADTTKPLADSLAVAFTEKPDTTVKDGKFTLKPALDSVNQARLKSYQVQVTMVSVDGQVSNKDYDIPPESTFTLNLPGNMLMTYTVTYLSKQYSTRDTTLYTTPLPSGFTDAVNAAAPRYDSLVRNLVGLPVAMKLSDLLTLMPSSAAKGPKPEAQTWNGQKKAWDLLPQDVDLAKGRGYLLALPKPVTPKLLQALTVDDLLRPDTLTLQAGWNVIANPKAIPFLDEEIGLDTPLVSRFYALKWTGSGSAATSDWKRADTLMPFRGYAVYAEKSTELIFNPLKNWKAKSQAKAASTLPSLRLNFAYAHGERARLYLESKPSLRHAPKSMLGESLKAYWTASQANVAAAEAWPRVNQSLRLFADKPGKIAFVAEGWARSDTLLALWDSRQGRFLLPGQNDSLLAQPGWNEYRLVALEKSALAAEESRLRAALPQAFTAALLAKQGRIWLQIPTGLSANASLTLEEYDLHGRRLGGRAWSNLMPGSLAWDLSSPRNGLRLVRITFVNGAAVQRQTVRAFFLGQKP